MTHLIDIDGVLVSSFAADVLLALVVLLALRPILGRLGFQRRAWNAPLAELGLFVCLIGVFVFLFD